MLHQDNLEALDEALRMAFSAHPDLAHPPFGENVVVFSGDLLQILSVVRDDDPSATVRVSLICSPL